jgi:hypothetical protein
VSHATGRQGDALVERAIKQAVQRVGHRPLTWYSDGWRGYRTILIRAYRQPVFTGRRRRPRFIVSPALRLTQTVKHRDAHGHLLRVEVVAALGPLAAAPGTVHVERLNGTLRDRLAALTRRTHAFAKRDATWDALVGLALWEHNWGRPHRALCHPDGGRSPAMAMGLSDHIWSWTELLTTSL